jgi:hypothetical protein
MKGPAEETAPPEAPLDVLFSADVSESEPESQSDAQTREPNTDDETHVQVPTIVSLPTPEPLPKQKPQWWSEAWDMLDGIQSESRFWPYLVPMSGAELRLKCESDIHAIDVYCSRSILDPNTGESRMANEQDEENQVVTGVMWSDEAITMSAVYGKSRDPNDMFVAHLKKMLDLCPAGHVLTLHPTSAFLKTKGEKFRALAESGTIGEVWD